MQIDLSRYRFLRYGSVLYVLLLLSVPMAVFKATALFVTASPSFIEYNWLGEYPYSFLAIPAIAYALVIFLFYRQTLFSRYLFYLYLLLCIFNLCTPSFYTFVVRYHSFEMYYALPFAFSLLAVVEYRLKTLSGFERFFELFIYIHAVGVLFSVATGLKSGRFNAQNLDVNTTGIVFSYYAVYLWLVKGRLSPWSILFPLAIILLTGARSPLIAVIAVCGLKFIGDIRKLSARKIALIAGVLLLGLLSPYLISLVPGINIDRFASLTSVSGIQDDDSFVGRTMSIAVGAEIVKDYPQGLNCSFLQLQSETVDRGFPTFPHSTVLCSYIQFGLLGIPFFIYLLVLLFRIRKSPYRYVLYFFFFMEVVSGGAMINFKLYFFYFLMFMMMTYSIRESGAGKRTEALPGVPDRV